MQKEKICVVQGEKLLLFFSVKRHTWISESVQMKIITYLRIKTKINQLKDKINVKRAMKKINFNIQSFFGNIVINFQ